MIESATTIGAPSYRGLKGWISDSNGSASEPCITEDQAKLEDAADAAVADRFRRFEEGVMFRRRS